MRTAMYEQQQHRSGLLIHRQGDGYVPPPEYQLTAMSDPSSWQPPPGPLSDNPPTLEANLGAKNIPLWVFFGLLSDLLYFIAV